MSEIKKIVVIGPESTGKSTLCGQLASYFNTIWCPEYAREYLLKNGMKYSYDDLLHIAKGQIRLEEEYLRKVRKSGRSEYKEALPNKRDLSFGPADIKFSGLLFIDTDLYVMKVWCEFVFGECHQYILDQIAKRKYDLYLLCDVDLEWRPDELREYPGLEIRQTLYQIYKDTMTNQPVSWIEIHGDKELRLQKAIQAVDSFLKE